MKRNCTFQLKNFALAALCCLLSLQAISQNFCVGTDAPVGASFGVSVTDVAQSLTVGGCPNGFAGITIDGSNLVTDGGSVWTLRIYQGDGFGGTLLYTQNGIAITAAYAGYIFVEIGGGSGSTVLTPGSQYTFRLSTTSMTNSFNVFRNNTSFYAGGQGYVAGASFGTGGDILDFNLFAADNPPPNPCNGATRLYVRANVSGGANNGTSWANAYSSLQSAIDYARGCNNIQEIWVAAGTYKPSKDKNGNASPSNATTKTFYIDFPIQLYGGFAGSESLLSQRNVNSNVTILSGDIDNNDTANPATTASNIQGANANAVIYFKNIANGFLLDGFTVTAAQFTSSTGGGIVNEGTGYPFGSNGTIRNCRSMGNAGPGFFNAGNLGTNSSGSATLVVGNCIISGNMEGFYSSGIFCNSNGGYTNTTVSNTTFSNNISTGSFYGGAYYEAASSGTADATFTNCIFNNNSSVANGGAVSANGSGVGRINHSFVNCTFFNNSTAAKGGAYNSNGTNSGNVSVGFTNCTFYNNSATGGGGAIASNTNNVNAQPLLLRNCILWQNGTEILNEGVATTTLTYSLITTTSAPAGVTASNSVFNSNPNFVNAGAGNLRIQGCSAAFNSGTSSGAPSTDLDGNARPAQGGFDMGAYELQSGGSAPTTYYRDMDGDGFGNPAVTQTACTQPVGYVANNTDCDDNDALEKPGQVWYKDTDNDGYGQTGAATITQCLRPAGYKVAAELTSTTGDCNDNNAAINPAATEVCDGVDNNCNNMTDEGELTTYYRDMDGDGFGNPAVTQTACTQPVGYVADNTDCDDNDALEKPGQVWYKDTDGDNYAETGAATIMQCLRPTGYKVAAELTSTTGDCNDNNAAIKPGAMEVCDGVDNNCNNMTDEGELTTYYRDMDGDDFGNPAVTQMACSVPMGYVTNNTDCNDNSALEKPGQVWYKDTDNDGYGQTGAATITQCLRPMGYKATSELTATTGDCNDGNAAINPAATEICDGIDNNCNSQTDEGTLTTWYRDMDGDGFGNPAVTQMACSQPMGYVANNTDCDDNDALEKPGQVWYKDVDGDDYSDGTTLTQCLRPANYYVAAELIATSGDCNDGNAAINPAATEVCDGIDNNCNMMTDEGVQTTYYRDMDGDGFGNPAVTQMACSQPMGYVLNNTDCNDNDALQKPGQVWYKDADGDDYSDGITLTQCLRPANYYAAAELIATSGDCNDNAAAINPGATEICDGIDNNCDSQMDEGVKTIYYADTDGDGFGDPNNTAIECSLPQGYVTNSDDCDDTDNTVYLGAEEICDSKDNDCNGTIDDVGGTTAGNWNSGDVGGANGSANYPPCNAEPEDVFTIDATGYSTSSSDKINLVYQELCGNGEIIARVTSVSSGGWAGITLRETLDPGSKKVAMKTQLSSNIRREIRSMTNGATTMLNLIRPQHVWLRLVRNGGNFVGYTSTDGNNWSFAFSANVSMAGCIYAGVFAESIGGTVTTTANFDNVSVTGGTLPLVSSDNAAQNLSGLNPVLDMNVYPNPTEGQVNLAIQTQLDQQVSIQVFNTLGETLILKKVDASERLTERLDLSEFADGVYYIQIQSAGYAPVTKRIVLAKADGLRR